MIILGIDPGLSGAFAIVGEDGVTVSDMPTFTIKRGKQRRSLDLDALVRSLQLSTVWGIDLAVIEEVHAMPAQGVVTTGQLMEAYGAVKGIVAALGIPRVLVPPAVWKQALRVSADKDSSRERASQLAPAHAHLWPAKKDHGRAEAFLLAIYGKRVTAQGMEQ